MLVVVVLWWIAAVGKSEKEVVFRGYEVFLRAETEKYFA